MHEDELKKSMEVITKIIEELFEFFAENEMTGLDVLRTMSCFWLGMASTCPKYLYEQLMEEIGYLEDALKEARLCKTEEFLENDTPKP